MFELPPRTSRLKQSAWLAGWAGAFIGLIFLTHRISESLQLSPLSSASLGQAGLLLLAILFPLLDGGGLLSLGLHGSWRRSDIAVIAALIIINFVGSMLMTFLLIRYLHLPVEDRAIFEFLESFRNYRTSTFMLIALGLALQSGIAEEMIFRGYLITRLEKIGFGALGCILTSALVFGLVHWPGYGLFPSLSKALWFGVPTGLFFWYRRSLGQTIAAHALMNFLGFTMIHLLAKFASLQ